jgi:hypothetical protein
VLRLSDRTNAAGAWFGWVNWHLALETIGDPYTISF